MEYPEKTVRLKDGAVCTLRSAAASDAAEVLELFLLTHRQTDYLTAPPQPGALTVEIEAAFLQRTAESPDKAEILALVNGKAAGFAGVTRVSLNEKLRHRASFGISVDRAYWGRGVGRALTLACIECARAAGCTQLELEAVAENTRALSLYQSVGFTQYGLNPRGFFSSASGWQPLVLMRLELEAPQTRQGGKTR